MVPYVACLMIVGVSHGLPPARDAQLDQVKKDLEYYGTFKAHWPGSAFPNQYQAIKVERIDAQGISIVKHLAYSTTDPLWKKPEHWTSTWEQFGRIDVISNKGTPGGPFIGLRTERPGAHGPYYLFFNLTLLDDQTAKAIGDELKQVASKYGSQLR